jgi:RimJ/RimL family protein N-acetyltransferase
VAAAGDEPIAIRLWAEGDLPLLRRVSGEPAMTVYLGGPETPEKIAERHDRYVRLAGTGKGAMFVIEVGGTPAGSIGYWDATSHGEEVYEVGWSVLPEFQGRGVATKATAALLERARAERRHRYADAFPSIHNLASNAICKRLGFAFLEECDFEYPKGRWIRGNAWRYDLFADPSRP